VTIKTFSGVLAVMADQAAARASLEATVRGTTVPVTPAPAASKPPAAAPQPKDHEVPVVLESAVPEPPPLAPLEPLGPEPDPRAAKYQVDGGGDFLKDWGAYQRAQALRDFKQAQHADAVTRAIEQRRNESRARAVEDFDDFADVLRSADIAVRAGRIPAPPGHVMETLGASDWQAHLLYHLASNPDEAARIFALPAGRAALALGQLEVKLERQSKAAAPEKAARREAKRAPSKPQPVTDPAQAKDFRHYKQLRGGARRGNAS
jgi:hypothetical protein